MTVTTQHHPHGLYRFDHYTIAPDCKGKITRDMVCTDNHPTHELWDGTRWYVVPKEVFDLFLKAYRLGRESQ